MDPTMFSMYPNGLRALLVDDDPRFVRRASMLLSVFNFKVSACGSPTSALKVLSAADKYKEFDVVIADAKKATAGGFDLKDIVELDLHIPVICFLSQDHRCAGAEAEALLRTLDLASFILEKSFKAEDICNLWRHIAWRKSYLNSSRKRGDIGQGSGGGNGLLPPCTGLSPLDESGEEEEEHVHFKEIHGVRGQKRMGVTKNPSSSSASSVPPVPARQRGHPPKNLNSSSRRGGTVDVGQGSSGGTGDAGQGSGGGTGDIGQGSGGGIGDVGQGSGGGNGLLLPCTGLSPLNEFGAEEEEYVHFKEICGVRSQKRMGVTKNPGSSSAGSVPPVPARRRGHPPKSLNSSSRRGGTVDIRQGGGGGTGDDGQGSGGSNCLLPPCAGLSPLDESGEEEEERVHFKEIHGMRGRKRKGVTKNPGSSSTGSIPPVPARRRSRPPKNREQTTEVAKAPPRKARSKNANKSDASASIPKPPEAIDAEPHQTPQPTQSKFVQSVLQTLDVPPYKPSILAVAVERGGPVISGSGNSTAVAPAPTQPPAYQAPQAAAPPLVHRAPPALAPAAGYPAPALSVVYQQQQMIPAGNLISNMVPPAAAKTMSTALTDKEAAVPHLLARAFGPFPYQGQPPPPAAQKDMFAPRNFDTRNIQLPLQQPPIAAGDPSTAGTVGCAAIGAAADAFDRNATAFMAPNVNQFASQENLEDYSFPLEALVDEDYMQMYDGLGGQQGGATEDATVDVDAARAYPNGGEGSMENWGVGPADGFAMLDDMLMNNAGSDLFPHYMNNGRE